MCERLCKTDLRQIQKMSKTAKVSMFFLLLIGGISPFFAEDIKKEADGGTKITAENFTYRIAKGEAVYTGDVVVLDSQIDIFTDKMTVFFVKAKPKGKEKLQPANNPPINGKKDKPNAPLAPIGGIGGNIDRIICEGNVIIVNKKDKATATGEKAVYTALTELMVVTGNAKLRTKSGVLFGKVIEYNRRTGDLTAKAAVLINEGKKEKKRAPTNPSGK